MKNFKLLIVSLLTLVFVSSAFAQKVYKYETVPNDPLQARIYTLDNGLKVYLSVYKDAPRIQCYVSVKVGSKNDPKETTGLAHYFEHMMFKGTPKMGTLDWDKEKVLIQKIEDLFEIYRITTDPAQRAVLYKQIDSLSYEASKLAVPNEYDKIMKFIGSQGTNAGTSNDYTVYIENIPSNQLENWAIVQADRFETPVLRLFHTELETVYEEKNMSLTNDSRASNDKLMTLLYPNHPYGQQTTLGNPEHLKNPSMKNIRMFFDQYYVPNNFAIVLSGDFNYDEAIAIIDKHFGHLKSKPVKPLVIKPEVPTTQPTSAEVIGLEAEFFRMAYRIDQPANSDEIYILNMVSQILYNGKAGLLDLNVNQKQLANSVAAFSYVLCDNSSLAFYGKPKEGQTLEQVRDIILAQIELLKQGKFDDALLASAINNMKLSEMRQLESNEARVRMMSNSFLNNIPWSAASQSIDKYSKITKQDIINFANKYFKNNYFIVYKRKGTPADIEKVNKPAITPIVINRDAESNFFKALRTNSVKTIDPVFVDFKKAITFSKAKGMDVMYIENVENKTFTITFQYKIGELNNLKLPIATSYFDYVGTSKYTPEQIKQQFYNLACNMNFSTNDEYTQLIISGLSENFEKALDLAIHVIKDAKPNEEALQEMIKGILQDRKDAKSNQNAISSALRNYGEFGPELVKYQLSEAELKALTATELIALAQTVFNYQPEIYYYGTEKMGTLLKKIETYYPAPKKFNTPPPAKEFDRIPVTQESVLFIPYEAKQARLYTYSQGQKFNMSQLPVITMYNQYFGGSMNAIVFQEMREKRSLAYTAQSRYSSANELDKFNYNFSYIATQNDKVIDAFTAFNELFNEMPQSQNAFDLAKDGALSSISTNRITKAAIFAFYRSTQKMGIDYDYRKNMYEQLQKFTLADIVAFNNQFIKNQKKTYMILAKEPDMNFPVLEQKFGKVKKLTLEEIFGF
jgi:predicted Zn-dependent peptidase